MIVRKCGEVHVPIPSFHVLSVPREVMIRSEKGWLENSQAQGTHQQNQEIRNYKRKIEATSTEQSLSTNPNGDSKANSRASVEIAPIARTEAVELGRVARLLAAASNFTRLQLLEFCLKPRRFTEIVRFLYMNPASFKFHVRLLSSQGLLRKDGSGRSARYRTTTVGKLVLDIVRGPLRRVKA